MNGEPIQNPAALTSPTSAIPSTVTGCHLPPFRPRRAAFVANLLSLFFGNEEETRLLQEEVGGIESYGGRLIPILDLLYAGGPTDLVLEAAPEEALLDYFSETLGLRLPTLHTLSHAHYLELGDQLKAQQPLATKLAAVANGLRASQLETIDGYVTDPILGALAAHCGTSTLSSFEGSRRGNNKYLLHTHLESAGLPVFETLMAASPEEVPQALAQLHAKGFERAVIKSQVGASGIGILKLATRSTEKSVPDLLFYEGPCMVQGWLDHDQPGVGVIHSPSVQLYLDDLSGVYLYDITEQILSHESVHEGNVSPPPHLVDHPEVQDELYRQATVAAEWLFRQGYRGTASVDFLLTMPSPGQEATFPPRAYICEINARVTGATYPSILARHFLPEGAWLMRNLKFLPAQPAQRILDLLDAQGHLFRPGREAGGVLPINFNSNQAGLVEKGQFLCLAPTVEQCERFLALGEADLPIDWDYVRD